ncbi:hypothetical protein Dsin_029133 [Dipteronia sinensis]|uniref:Uncharacterized protein n=1 Tax=Dipteronia sinensis TaxID=43782 RepID=A0AAD9ZS35_9ROSI|nr:hypothetical protein Dsin_029133 [Dipteronia sinensis]
MALNLKSLLFVSLFIALVAAPIAEATFPIRLVQINGTVFCTPNGTIVTGTTPPFPLAQVQLRCGLLTVVSAITNSAGVFSSIGLFPLQLSLSALLSTCNLRVNTPLSFCNSTLSPVGRLQSPIQFTGSIQTGLVNITIVGPSQARTFALGFLSNQMMGMARESEEIKKAVVNLPKYLVNKAPEKAEPRGLAVEAILEIVKAMEVEDQIGFAEYTVKMSRGKANLRLLAVDLILTIMMSLRDPLGVDLDVEVENSCGFSCLEALIQRCSSNLAQLVGFLSNDDRTRRVLKQVIGSEEGEMNGLLRKRCTDEKATVRKAALLLITKVTSLLGGSIDKFILKTMGMSCSDPLVSIRKAAITALSEA